MLTFECSWTRDTKTRGPNSVCERIFRSPISSELSPGQSNRNKSFGYSAVDLDQTSFTGSSFLLSQNDLDDPDRGMIFVCSATHKTKSMFFFLVQTEQGDVFKITLETDEDMVTEIKMKYFDTVPVATAMCVLRTGFLFVASEFGNQ